MAEITLLDLDAAGIDLDEPCPPDFMQFVYENSQDGHLTLWSHVLSEPGGPARIQKWFDEGLAEYHSRTIQIQMAPPTPNPPSGDNVTEVTYPEGSTTPPVNVDVPHVAVATPSAVPLPARWATGRGHQPHMLTPGPATGSPPATPVRPIAC